MGDASGPADGRLLSATSREGSGGAPGPRDADQPPTERLQGSANHWRLTLGDPGHPSFDAVLTLFLQVVAPDAY